MTPKRPSLLTQVHELKRTLTEQAWYPPHQPRKYFGSKFKAVEDHLTKELDLPCLVCGVTHSTLKTQKNRFGAKQMEAHHRLIEWSLSNAIDPVKFNARIRPYLHRVGVDETFQDLYSRDMTHEEICDWIDHSTDNLWILCDVHHRGRRHGIHSITGPIWGPQDLLLDSFVADTEKRMNDEDEHQSHSGRTDRAAHQRRVPHRSRRPVRRTAKR